MKIFGNTFYGDIKGRDASSIKRKTTFCCQKNILEEKTTSAVQALTIQQFNQVPTRKKIIQQKIKEK